MTDKRLNTRSSKLRLTTKYFSLMKALSNENRKSSLRSLQLKTLLRENKMKSRNTSACSKFTTLKLRKIVQAIAHTAVCVNKLRLKASHLMKLEKGGSERTLRMLRRLMLRKKAR